MNFTLPKILGSEVMSHFGTSFSLSASNEERVGVRCRKSICFNGPITVEGVRVGITAEETTADARVNRQFLEKVLANI